jgi:hypothetical protein
MTVEWLYNEEVNTLGHVAKLKLEGHTAISPQHALTVQDIDAFTIADEKITSDNIVISGESINYSTFQGLGKQATVTDALIKRLQNKIIPNRINFVYGRIPSGYKVNDSIHPVLNVDDLQASALVGAQLEANANAIIPPLPNGLTSYKIFKRVLDRTKIEIQTFNKEREIIGLVPKTEHLDLIPSMIKDYEKLGVNIFAIDFCGAYLPRSLIRITVGSIRKTKKIKKKDEPKDKHYYLHIFNSASCVKTASPTTAITDILTHAYGVDSTSGIMWGGGKLDHNKLRYYNMADYGAYNIGRMKEYGVTAPFDIPDGAIRAYKILRAHRIIDYSNDCKTNITESISNGDQTKSYASYLNSKTRAKEQVKNILSDIKEIKASI